MDRLVSPIVVLLCLGFAACSVQITTESPLTTAISVFRADGMEFTATVSTVPSDDRVLEATVRIENVSANAGQTTILGGNCMLRLRLYDATDGSTRWSQFDEIDACQEPARVISLDPGNVELITTQVAVGVGPGVYFATVTIEYLAGVTGGFVELVAGNVTVR